MKSGLAGDVDGAQVGTTDAGEHDKTRKSTIDPRAKISSLLKDKEREWTAVVENRKGPLRLLDLPMDVLKEIVKEVTAPLPRCRHLLISSFSRLRIQMT
jgi:hypothetical protein